MQRDLEVHFRPKMQMGYVLMPFNFLFMVTHKLYLHSYHVFCEYRSQDFVLENLCSNP